MKTRRHFIALVPLAGVSLLAGCSDKAAAPAPAPAPAPAAPSPAPEPAPTAAAPAPATPAPAPAPTPAPAAAAAPAAPMPALSPSDPQAASLGYVTDTAQADNTRFPAHTAAMACVNCALYGGKPGDTAGPCPIFGGRQVSAKGWCSAYNKKA